MELTINEIRKINYEILRKESGLDKGKFAEKIGTDPSYMSQIFSEKSKRNIGLALARKIEQAVGKDIGWMDVMHEDLADYIDSTTTRIELPSPTPNYVLGELELWDGSTPLRDDEVALPYFREVELAAGSSRHEVIENCGMKLRFAKSTLKNQAVLECNAACATISGNSMEPKLHNGTAIGIDKGTTNIIDGEMYAIDHDGSLRVKYLYKMPGGALRLRSENRDEWPDETLSFEEAKSVKVIGWVFWWSTLPKRRYA